MPGVRAASRPSSGRRSTALAQAGKIKLVYHVKNFLDDNLGNDSLDPGGQRRLLRGSDAGKFQEFHDQVFTEPAGPGG